MSTDGDTKTPDPAMTIGGHLEVLRWHILKCVLYVIVGLCICLAFQDYLMAWATWPHRKVVNQLQREAKVVGAPPELRELISDAAGSYRDTEAALEKAERIELSLREALEPSTERLEELRRAQDHLAFRVDSLVEKAEALGGGGGDRASIAALASERAALTAEAAALQKRVQVEALPFLDRHARAPRLELVQIKYQETFLAYLKLALVAGLFLVSPLVAYELWNFVAVGLYPNEKRYINLFAPLTFFAFALGGTFGYFILIPFGLRFLATYAPADMVAGTFAIGDYLSLFTTLTIVVGLVFELPLVMSFLTLIRVGSPEWFRKYRRYMLLGAFIVAAMLTPPDPVTQCLMAIPLVLLYEIGIMSSAFIVANRTDPVEEETLDAEALPAADPPKAPPALPPPTPDADAGSQDEAASEAADEAADEDEEEEEDPEELRRERERADAEEAAKARERAEAAKAKAPEQPTVARGSLADEIDSDNPDDMDNS